MECDTLIDKCTHLHYLSRSIQKQIGLVLNNICLWCVNICVYMGICVCFYVHVFVRFNVGGATYYKS